MSATITRRSRSSTGTKHATQMTPLCSWRGPLLHTPNGNRRTDLLALVRYPRDPDPADGVTIIATGTPVTRRKMFPSTMTAWTDLEARLDEFFGLVVAQGNATRASYRGPSRPCSATMPGLELVVASWPRGVGRPCAAPASKRFAPTGDYCDRRTLR